MAKTKLEEKRLELKATVAYGEEIAAKAKDVSDDSALAEYREEMTQTESKADSLRTEIKGLEKDEARQARIRSIGTDIFGAQTEKVEEEEAQYYADPIKQFMASETFKTFVADVKSGNRNASTSPVEFKAPVSVVSGGFAADKQNNYAPGFARQDFTFPYDVGSLFSQGQMTGSSISYLLTSSADAQAAYQTSLGAQKGGTFALELDVATVRAMTIAAVATIPSQNLDDIPALEAEVRQILLEGPGSLGEKLEDAYLNGTGPTGQLDGILGELTPDNVDLAGDYNSKAIFKAMADIKEEIGFTADAVVVHPDDWYILSTEVGTEDNRPLNTPWGGGWGANGVGPRLVVSRAATSGQAVVGAFKSSTLYTRQATTVSADASGIGLRDKNLVLFVAETRQALVHRYGDAPYRTVTISA